jgi:UDP-3-O-[3-hydroxymyristoyl] glucosamine N-acyltransferase LpxD
MKGFNVLRATLYEHEIRRVIGLPEEGERVVAGVAPLDAAEDCCLYFVNQTVTSALRESLAARQGCIVIAPRGSAAGAWGDCLVLEVAWPRTAIAKILGFIRAERRQLPLVNASRIAPDASISPLAVVEGLVEIGEGVVIEPFCTVGPDVVIGAGSILRSGVRVYQRVSIGAESVIGANTVIGCEGYGFVRDEAGNKTRIAHLGGVRIGAHVEIGALSVIQCGTISPTIIEDHAKIGDLAGVGHNGRVERGASLIGGALIGGSAVIGAKARIGMNATIRSGCQVGARAQVGMDVSVQHDLPDRTCARAPQSEIRTRTKAQRAATEFEE